MKKLILAIAIAACTLTANAQNYNYKQQQQTSTTSTGFDKTKLTFGGGFGLQFGNYTLVNIAPQVGYNFSKMFNAGAGVSYSYYGDSYDSGAGMRYKDSRSYFGFNVYGRFYPIENIVLMVQPEANRMWRTTKNKSNGDKISENKFVPSLLVGGGLRLGPMTAMIQYDLAQNSHSPYSDKIFYSVGYSFSF